MTLRRRNSNIVFFFFFLSCKDKEKKINSMCLEIYFENSNEKITIWMNRTKSSLFSTFIDFLTVSLSSTGLELFSLRKYILTLLIWNTSSSCLPKLNKHYSWNDLFNLLLKLISFNLIFSEIAQKRSKNWGERKKEAEERMLSCWGWACIWMLVLEIQVPENIENRRINRNKINDFTLTKRTLLHNLINFILILI